MNYQTVEVEFDHGRVVPSGKETLPEKGKGLLTILDSPDRDEEIKNLTPLEAFGALQKHLNLDPATAKNWMETVRAGRR